MLLGIIGGSGIDEIPEFASGRVIDVSTRFGDAQVIRAEMEGANILFVPRHGLAHNTPPSQINYRALIAALRKMGVKRTVGICAVGSLNARLQPGTFAVLGDFIDLTRHRAVTFFDDPSGPLVHTDLSEPYCPVVSSAILSACREARAPCHSAAVYVGVDGPRYESPAEVRLYASWGGDVIGMTNLPEAVLAREAGICYGALAVVTNLAAGLGNQPLLHNEVCNTVVALGDQLRTVVYSALNGVRNDGDCNCHSSSALSV